MGASVNACTSPGSTSSSLLSVCLGLVTSTTGTDDCCASRFSAARDCTRVNMPQAAMMIAASSTYSATRLIRRNAARAWGVSVICCRVALGVRCASLAARLGKSAVDDGKHHRYEQQRCKRGKHQPADHRPPERRVLLAALAQAQGHWQHADYHRQC